MASDALWAAQRNLAAGICFRPALLTELGISHEAFADPLCRAVVFCATVASKTWGDQNSIDDATLFVVANEDPEGCPFGREGADRSDVAELIRCGDFYWQTAVSSWRIVRNDWRRREYIQRLARLTGPETNVDEAIPELRRLCDRLEADGVVDSWGAPMTLADLVRDYPSLRPPVIDGLLRQGETGNLIAKSKVGKSWLAYGVAISVATGRQLWDRFDCTSGRVLIVDNELHPEVLASRIPAVAQAMGLSVDDLARNLDVVSLRGQLLGLDDIGSIIRRSGEPYRLVIVDALYRAMPDGSKENSNDDMTGVYNAIDVEARKSGAAFLLIHHASKGNQSDKDVTDVGSGAGAQSRAADLHLVLRPHQEEGIIVAEAAVRSFAPVEPFCLAWSFPVWVPADDADPQQLKRQPTKGDERQASKDAEGAGKIVDALRREGGRLTESKLRKETGFGQSRVARLLRLMEADGRLQRNTIDVRGNDCTEYMLADHLMTQKA